MTTEIYKGRKIVTRIRRGRDGREVRATVNGVEAMSTYAYDGAEAKVLDNIHCQIDFIDQKPVDGSRWSIEWYDPKTVELCPEGIHAQERGGKCTHPTCVEMRAETAGAATQA
jgi:hypothetical protein